MDKTMYKVIVDGATWPHNYKSADRAIGVAKKWIVETENVYVVMVVESGSYRSTTAIWPCVGDTYTN